MTRRPEEIRDELLVLRCLRRDLQAWDDLVNRYNNRLFYYVRRMVWVFSLLMSIFFCVIGMSRPDKPLSMLLMLQSLIFLISAAVYWLNHRIEESELNVKEKLLELELILAEFKSAP